MLSAANILRHAERSNQERKAVLVAQSKHPYALPLDVSLEGTLNASLA